MDPRKYQIFVSSTYTDLRSEREQVIRAILEMGHIPVGMELFSAADESQWRLIQRQVDQSDYYIVIAAHRYGTRDGSVSYTEKEHAYAIEQHIPAIAFIIDPDAPWPPDRRDGDSKDVRDLDAFKEKLKRQPVGFWRTADELGKKVSISVGKLIDARPRPGWVRATGAAGEPLIDKLVAADYELRAKARSMSCPFVMDSVTMLVQVEQDAFDEQHSNRPGIRANIRIIYVMHMLQDINGEDPIFHERFENPSSRLVPRPGTEMQTSHFHHIDHSYSGEWSIRFDASAGERRTVVTAFDEVYESSRLSTSRPLDECLSLGPGELGWAYPNDSDLIAELTMMVESRTLLIEPVAGAAKRIRQSHIADQANPARRTEGRASSVSYRWTNIMPRETAVLVVRCRAGAHLSRDAQGGE